MIVFSIRHFTTGMMNYCMRVYRLEGSRGSDSCPVHSADRLMDEKPGDYV
jgi:hypothetical protein